MHVSIIVVTYNSSDDTNKCLQSLSELQTKDAKVNVLVVDNGSREHYELPEHIRVDMFEVLRSEANLGFTGGNNLGIYNAVEKYNSEYVLLLNNDTIVDTKLVTKLLQCAKNNPTLGVVCPKIYFYPGNEFHASYARNQKGSVLWYAGGSIDWSSLSAFHRGVDEVDRGHFDAQEASEFATGCAMLLKREVLEKVGIFDKRFFLYFEDVDLSERIKKAGYKIGFCPEAVVWHRNAQSSGGSGSDTHRYYLARNKLLFTFKHGGFKDIVLGVRVWLQYALRGTTLEQQAALDFLFQRFGKQPVVLHAE